MAYSRDVRAWPKWKWWQKTDQRHGKGNTLKNVGNTERADPNLVRELSAEDPEAFPQIHSLDRESFETILAMFAPLIKKQNTHCNILLTKPPAATLKSKLLPHVSKPCSFIARRIRRKRDRGNG